MDKHINIIGNGPSLNKIDKNKLFSSNNINISYNRAYIIYEKYNFYPDYYFCIDKAVLLNCLKDIIKLINTPIKNIILLKCKETIPLLKISKKIKLIHKTKLSSLFFGDVATYSIFYLTLLKYKNFNIYGCDCSYIENYDKLNVNVIYNNNDKSRRIILKPKKNSKDPNHFIDNYFDDSTEYSVPRTNNHLKCWKNIKKN